MELGPLKFLAYSGGEWVIYLLIGCSVWAVAVILEKYVLQKKEWEATQSIQKDIKDHFNKGEWEKAHDRLKSVQGAFSSILLAGVQHIKKGKSSMEEHVAAVRIIEKKRLEQRLLILGTLGNNAPFIGLFGTVLGVIKAFHDLATTQSAGPEVVMQGLSEALVATAVGLLVAMPSVMAYNYFQKRVNDLLSDAESHIRLLVAKLTEE